MSTTSTYRDVASQLARFADQHEILFERGDIVSYFTNVAPFHEGFCLTNSAKQHEDSLLLKSMLSLWNLTIDDDIDLHSSTALLNESIQWLANLPPQLPIPPPPRGPTSLIHQIVTKTCGSDGNLDSRVELDLHLLLAGMKYEAIANRQLHIVNSSEYLRISCMSGGIIGYIDIDLALAQAEVQQSDYVKVRDACDSFSTSLKLAFDIGALNRDLFKEINDSFVTIRARELGLSFGSDAVSRSHLKESDFLPAIDDARTLAKDYFGRGVRALDSVEGIGDQLIKTVAGLIGAEEDWFPSSVLP